MVRIDPAGIGDMLEAADVFCAAFPASLKFYVGNARPVKAIRDVFSLCLRSQKGHFFILTEEGKVAGYIIAPYSMKAIAKDAIFNGCALRIFWRWLIGSYGISASSALRPALEAIKNLYKREDASLTCDSRILSIGVYPSSQGKGYGKMLLEAGLDALEKAGVGRVRLEVRPENDHAICLYSRYGFKTVGSMKDAQGRWLVMIREMNGEIRTKESQI